jgi:hypothetical protein
MGNFRYCETLSFVFVVLMILFLLVDLLLSPLYSTHTIASRGVALTKTALLSCAFKKNLLFLFFFYMVVDCLLLWMPFLLVGA